MNYETKENIFLTILLICAIAFIFKCRADIAASKAQARIADSLESIDVNTKNIDGDLDNITNRIWLKWPMGVK